MRKPTDFLDLLERVEREAFAHGVAMGRRFNTKTEHGLHRASTEHLFKLYQESKGANSKVDQALKGLMP